MFSGKALSTARRRVVDRWALRCGLVLACTAPSVFGAIDFQDEYAKQIKAADTVIR